MTFSSKAGQLEASTYFSRQTSRNLQTLGIKFSPLLAPSYLMPQGWRQAQRGAFADSVFLSLIAQIEGTKGPASQKSSNTAPTIRPANQDWKTCALIPRRLHATTRRGNYTRTCNAAPTISHLSELSGCQEAQHKFMRQEINDLDQKSHHDPSATKLCCVCKACQFASLEEIFLLTVNLQGGTAQPRTTLKLHMYIYTYACYDCYYGCHRYHFYD